MSNWQPIDTAPRADGVTEILASDFDAIEIICWDEIEGIWKDRNGDYFWPAYWQPLPDHPEAL